ncbi:MoaD/ThiS family protein [Nocardioides ferulae]|uniref:MoaD/ThiS family protein n=1 Tax=Nocardioides ferulae TaxID=2340821 RepID=UPI001F0BE41A|nr:MoaD/ThiS family protein [Nocardioides ferulae]
MSDEMQIIRVHYWAAAKAAAGVAGEELQVSGPISLAEVVRQAGERHPDSRLPRVLQTCSALLGDQPAGSADPETVVVQPGTTVEFLPPFAGG